LQYCLKNAIKAPFVTKNSTGQSMVGACNGLYVLGKILLHMGDLQLAVCEGCHCCLRASIENLEHVEN
jgi:hypothetical protein